MDFWRLNVGDKVRGIYYGVPYSGTITNVRPSTVNEQWHFYVAFDRPLNVPMIQVEGRTEGLIRIPSKHATLEGRNPRLGLPLVTGLVVLMLAYGWWEGRVTS